MVVTGLTAEHAGDGYLEAVDGSVMIAAAEVVAAARDQPSPLLPPSVIAWVDAHRAGCRDDVVVLARLAVERVLGANSELRDLWNDAGDRSWLATATDLRRRLR